MCYELSSRLHLAYALGLTPYAFKPQASSFKLTAGVSYVL